MSSTAWGASATNNAQKWNITQSTFVPTGSQKVRGKPFSSVSEDVNDLLASKLKKYNVAGDMRRYVKIMKNEKDEAVNEAVQTDHGVRYTNKKGLLTYIDGDAMDEIYRNEEYIEDQIDELVRKALKSDTCSHIILGNLYDDLGAGEGLTNNELIRELCPNYVSGTLSEKKYPSMYAEARPMILRTISPKSQEFSLGIIKLRALIKIASPIVEHKSSLANDNINNTSQIKLPTGTSGI